MVNFLEKLGNIDPRVLYILLIVLVLIPLMKPLGLPVRVGSEAQAYYDTIEQLPPDSVVLICCDYGPGTDAECWPMTLASVRHLFRKDAKIIGCTLKPTGVMYVERVFDKLTEDEFPDKEYGVDYVVLPYVAGQDRAVASMAKDFRATFPTDYYGNKATELPLLQSTTQATDLSLILVWCSSDALIWFPQQFESPTKVKVVGGCTAVSLSGFMPYFRSGQISGLLLGIRGAAEYEQMVGSIGEASAVMDAQSMAHLLLMGCVVLGNISLVAKRKLRKESEEL